MSHSAAPQERRECHPTGSNNARQCLCQSQTAIKIGGKGESAMSTWEYIDRLQLLHDSREIISEAQARGLPTGFFTEETASRINTLMDLDIIDRQSPGSMKLSAEFRSTLSDIAPGRNFNDFSRHEIERVALVLTD